MPSHSSPQASLHQATGTHDPCVEKCISRHLPDDPASALALLPTIPCENTRLKLAALIATAVDNDGMVGLSAPVRVKVTSLGAPKTEKSARPAK